MGFLNILLGVLFLVICFLLIIVILLQKGKGGGLGAAFGGMGSSAFGTRTGDVFTWVTIVLTGLFLLLAIGAGLAFRPPADVVLPPMFTPAPGPITERITVSMTCNTKGTTIRYTTDGTEPDENSAPYENNPKPIEPGTTLKARAFRAGWTPSTTTVGEYPKDQPTTLPSLIKPGDLGSLLMPTTQPAKPAGPEMPAPTTMPATN